MNVEAVRPRALRVVHLLGCLPPPLLHRRMPMIALPRSVPAMAPVPAAVIVSLIGLYAAVTNADGVPASCSALVPNLRGVNQEPSDPAEYGEAAPPARPPQHQAAASTCRGLEPEKPGLLSSPAGRSCA